LTGSKTWEDRHIHRAISPVTVISRGVGECRC